MIIHPGEAARPEVMTHHGTTNKPPRTSEETASTTSTTNKPAIPIRTMTVALPQGGKTELVYIPALDGWAGKYEVTNQEYRKFDPRHNSGFYKSYNLNCPRQPVCEVSFSNALAFCEWMNKACAATIPTGSCFRLPDKKEWMTLAQSGDNRSYPWGNEWPPTQGNFGDMTLKDAFPSWQVIDGYRDGFVVSCPVELSGTNSLGLYGVGGNVWEWTSERNGSARVIRGSCWNITIRDLLRCLYSCSCEPSDTSNDVGFRVMLMPDPTLSTNKLPVSVKAPTTKRY